MFEFIHKHGLINLVAIGECAMSILHIILILTKIKLNIINFITLLLLLIWLPNKYLCSHLRPNISLHMHYRINKNNSNNALYKKECTYIFFYSFQTMFAIDCLYEMIISKCDIFTSISFARLRLNVRNRQVEWCTMRTATCSSCLSGDRSSSPQKWAFSTTSNPATFWYSSWPDLTWPNLKIAPVCGWGRLSRGGSSSQWIGRRAGNRVEFFRAMCWKFLAGTLSCLG